MQYNMSGDQRAPDLRDQTREMANRLTSMFQVLSWVVVIGGALIALATGVSAASLGSAGAFFLAVLGGALYTFFAWVSVQVMRVVVGYITVRLSA